MTELHMTRGLPGSGKSTFAKEWVAADPANRARLNRDDVRGMIHPAYTGFPTERAASMVQHNAANGLLRKGIDVIVDDTNLVARHAKEWLKLAERQGATVIWHDQFLDVPLVECIRRDAARERSVGEDVIRSMHNRFVASGKLAVPVLPAEAEQMVTRYTGTPGKPKAVIVDIDGTLAINDHGRSPYDWAKVADDAVCQPVVDLINSLTADGFLVVVMSGRDSVCRDDTEAWLSRMCRWDEGMDYAELLMRPADDNRKDSIIKAELFAAIRDEYDVKYVIDDRNQVVKMWRSLGLTVLQVADGDF